MKKVMVSLFLTCVVFLGFNLIPVYAPYREYAQEYVSSETVAELCNSWMEASASMHSFKYDVINQAEININEIGLGETMFIPVCESYFPAFLDLLSVTHNEVNMATERARATCSDIFDVTHVHVVITRQTDGGLSVGTQWTGSVRAAE